MNFFLVCLFKLTYLIRPTDIILIAIGTILFLCALLVLYGLFVRPKPIALSSLNVRVYSYNVESKVFRFFDKNNLSNMRSYSLNQFFAQFLASDQEKIKAWLSSIENGQPFSESIQVNVKIRSNLSSLPSMLEYTSYNPENKIIHFESYIVPHLSKININLKGNIGHKKRFLLEDLDKCQEFVDKKSEDRIVAFYNFKIFFSNQEFRDEENFIDLKEINEQLRKILAQFLNKDTRMYFMNEHEQLIIDRSISSRSIAQNVGNTYLSTLKQFISFNVKVPYVKVALSITLSQYCDSNVRKALSQNASIINLIINDFKTEKVIMYDQNILNKNIVEQTNLHDIKMLIKNSTFRLYFEPSLDIQKEKQAFYSLKFIPYGTSMQSLREVLLFTSRIPGANISLYHSIIEKLESRLLPNTQPSILIRLPLSEVKPFINTLNEDYSSLKVYWTIGIREKEFLEIINDLDSALEFIRFIHSNNIRFAIYFNEATTILPRGLLTETDYFIYDNESSEALKENDLQANLRVIKSNIGIYNGKICFLNLKTIADIELYAHYCGTIFHCDELKQRSSTLEGLDYDKIKLVTDQTKKFMPQTSNISLDMYNDLSQQKDVFSDSEENKKTARGRKKKENKE